MSMNPRRALRVAQQELNEAVERYLMYGTGDPTGLEKAWSAFDEARRNLDGAGAAGKRYTSIATAYTDLPAKKSHRHDVIRVVVARWLMHGQGMTTAEIEGVTRKSHQSISSAVNHCEAAGWIKDSGKRKPTQFNRPAIVYVPTDLAIEAMRVEVAFS